MIHLLNFIYLYSPAVLDRETQSLHPTFVEYIDGARLYLENETDKEAPAVRDIKLHFCNFIRKMIKSFSCKYFIYVKIFIINILTNSYFLYISGNMSYIVKKGLKTEFIYAIC